MTENKRFENRLNKDYVKFNTLNPVWDNEKETALNVFEMITLLNELHDEVVKRDLFKLTVAMAIQHRINWLKKQLWDNTDRIDELQSLKKELKL